MAVTHDEVVQVALLAKLRLERDEVDRLTIELNDILNHMDELSGVDVTDVAPFIHAADTGAESPQQAGLREDEGPADALQAAPAEFGTDVEAGFFTVPRLSAHTEPDDE